MAVMAEQNCKSWENGFYLFPLHNWSPRFLTFLPPGVILISFDLSVVLNLEAVFKNFHFTMKTARPDVERQ